MNGQRSSYDELVVDTSIVVKFLVEEADSDKADALYQEFLEGNVRLVAVDFLFIESLSALSVRVRHGELTESDAEVKIRELASLSQRMTVVPVTAILLETLAIAGYFQQTVYDAAPLALAETRGVPLLTADQKFYRRVQPHARALLLRDLEI